jgi:hypothetical protein
MDHAIRIITDLTAIHPEIENTLVDLVALGYREGMIDAYGGSKAEPEHVQYSLFASEEFFDEVCGILSEHAANDTLENRIKNWF